VIEHIRASNATITRSTGSACPARAETCRSVLLPGWRRSSIWRVVRRPVGGIKMLTNLQVRRTPPEDFAGRSIRVPGEWEVARR